MIITAYEHANHYFETAAFTVVAVPVLVYAIVLPGLGRLRSVERWAAAQEVDRATALADTYRYVRETFFRAMVVTAVWATILAVVVGAIAGATWWRVVQYGVWGAVLGATTQLAASHSFSEVSLRPARAALAGDTGIGDSLPRSRPTFAAWSNMFMLGVAFVFALAGAMLAAEIGRAHV